MFEILNKNWTNKNTAFSFESLKGLFLWRLALWETNPQPQQSPTKHQHWKDEKFWLIIEKQMLRNESLEDLKFW